MIATKQKTRCSTLNEQINELSLLSRVELIELWVKQFKCKPPKGVKRGLLERAASHRLQAKRSGKLKPATQRALIAIASDQDQATTALPSPTFANGSRLVREWHGKSHQVSVTDDGFEWNGEKYSSLSAIALAITGTKWSGPRFFGVSS
ncbi:MAG: DUF2924 domain-containing protein [Pseudomonadota bacterium]